MWDAVIIGRGETGYATASYLHGQGQKVAITDSRASPPLLVRLQKQHPSIETYLGGLSHDILREAKKIVISPGICPKDPDIIKIVQEYGDRIHSDIDLFQEEWPRQVIAITGSNGKSTVLKMLYDILKHDGQSCVMIGNVGTPVLSLLEKEDKEYPAWAIIEVSSFQLHWSKKMRCDYGAIINLYPNHLDWHDDFNAYVEAKLSLLKQADEAFIDARSAHTLREHRVEKAVNLIEYEQGKKEVIDFFPKNLEENATAAIVIARKIGVEQGVIKKALQEFQPWPYRCELTSQEQGFWYNDAKSSNLAAAQHALQSISSKHSKKVVWIAGGIAKNESFDGLSSWAKEVVSHTICFGQDANQFLQALKGRCQVSPVGNLREAVALARKVVQNEEGVVVFSPAAASFDQFKNYKHRGLCFNELVKDSVGAISGAR